MLMMLMLKYIEIGLQAELRLSCELVLQAMLASANVMGQNPRYVDSGATHHLTADASNIASASSYGGSESVTTANGEGCKDRTNSFFKVPVRMVFILYKAPLHLQLLQQPLLVIKLLQQYGIEDYPILLFNLLVG
ncbi:uncharacterized protein LOC113332604 isoform X2 [Papaver somniferum]|uniref:uncharacterized protein LOC113332604 isoform X2 n=1 Tax=Papaver somniferum TaxID=3469 RepID=UPI000E6FF4C9|nr:uncharacterized protein LOC113332604 isoform X2 [Papaver somniferum]